MTKSLDGNVVRPGVLTRLGVAGHRRPPLSAEVPRGGDLILAGPNGSGLFLNLQIFHHDLSLPPVDYCPFFLINWRSSSPPGPRDFLLHVIDIRFALPIFLKRFYHPISLEESCYQTNEQTCRSRHRQHMTNLKKFFRRTTIPPLRPGDAEKHI